MTRWMRVGLPMVLWRLGLGVMFVLWFLSVLVLNDVGIGGVGRPIFEVLILVGLSVLYGWGHVLGSVEYVYEKWGSLGAARQQRFRRLVPAAALWLWSYNALLLVVLALFASDQLPYRSPRLWVVAGLVWLMAISTALPLYRRLKACLPSGCKNAESPQRPNRSC